ncbi:hypothetical protein ACFCZV_00115 [Streptomyces hydrogenans]|uniref:hypothetical protein n=1 Tax=Streptomyces hydrogenans TaxID=1873719 RepID=UPI0033A7A25B
MQTKVMATVIVVLIAFVAGYLVSLLGAEKLAAVSIGGGAFLGTASLGMFILSYLPPDIQLKKNAGAGHPARPAQACTPHRRLPSPV